VAINNIKIVLKFCVISSSSVQHLTCLWYKEKHIVSPLTKTPGNEDQGMPQCTRSLLMTGPLEERVPDILLNRRLIDCLHNQSGRFGEHKNPLPQLQIERQFLSNP
jgi:hypothetical protein